MRILLCLMCWMLLYLFSACHQTAIAEKESYSRWVGDIAFDPKLDNADFKICDETKALQYFWSPEKPYKGEKIAIEEFFETHYDTQKAKKESGLIRVRFLVNCEGKTGRFRLLGMDKAYHEKTFDPSITRQLLDLSQQLDQWKVLTYDGQIRDYYQYLIFKMDAGKIVEILP